jgi:hypothetical protein
MASLRKAASLHAIYYATKLLDTSKLYREGRESLRSGLTLFDTEWENIRVGQSWVAEHAAVDSIAEELCCHYPNAGFDLLGLRLHPRDWIGWLEPALEAARHLQNETLVSAHLGNLGAAYMMLGDARRAIEFNGRFCGLTMIAKS